MTVGVAFVTEKAVAVVALLAVKAVVDVGVKAAFRKLAPIGSALVTQVAIPELTVGVVHPTARWLRWSSWLRM